MSKTDLFILYRNYLFALQEREKCGDKYGDTDEIIKMFEDELKIVNKNNVLTETINNKKKNK